MAIMAQKEMCIALGTQKSELKSNKKFNKCSTYIKVVQTSTPQPEIIS